MPLVVMCGFPSSGKTTRAADLAEQLRADGHKVHVVSDHVLALDPSKAYATSAEEKMARGGVKSEVERLLTKEDIVIVDSPNYIKGFRYELYCISRSLSTGHCVVHAAASEAQCSEWHKERESPYTEKIFTELLMRFEPPDSRNRWDKPLFTLAPEDPLPYKDICDAIFQRQLARPNQSTQSLPLSDTNFLFELDRCTQDVVLAVMQAQGLAVIGDSIPVPNTKDKVLLKKKLTLPELRRVQRQFIAYTKMHPVANVEAIASLFVKFINQL